MIFKIIIFLMFIAILLSIVFRETFAIEEVNGGYKASLVNFSKIKRSKSLKTKVMIEKELDQVVDHQ